MKKKKQAEKRQPNEDRNGHVRLGHAIQSSISAPAHFEHDDSVVHHVGVELKEPPVASHGARGERRHPGAVRRIHGGLPRHAAATAGQAGIAGNERLMPFVAPRSIKKGLD